MSYFTAVMASDGRGWRTRDVDVEDAASLEDLADTLRGLGRDGEPVLAVIEREDEWFALVRVDGDDEARVFVSDLAAASRSIFAELLAPAADVDTSWASTGAGERQDVEDLDEGPEVADDEEDGDADLDVDLDEGLDDDLGDLDQEDPEPPPAWAGHADLLSDLGVDRQLLVELCEEYSDDPATVLAEIGEKAGFADLLEALR
ncbi:MAG: tRNA adenosine deaminase-associated protein [Actinomycetes bacterium]